MVSEAVLFPQEAQVLEVVTIAFGAPLVSSAEGLAHVPRRWFNAYFKWGPVAPLLIGRRRLHSRWLDSMPH